MGVCTSKHNNNVREGFRKQTSVIEFPRLSSTHSEVQARYDVIVIGSGYGASIAASRSARAGQTVCVLERGKEWRPGEFPEDMKDGAKEMQISFGGKLPRTGDVTGLYEFVVSDDVTVVQGCGLGGGSLINANVGLECDPRVFEDPVWPRDFTADLNDINTIDSAHVSQMLKPTKYPDSYPKLLKTERLKDTLKGFDPTDIEDLDKSCYKVPLFVNFKDQEKNHVGVPQPACVGCGNCCSGCNTGAKNTLAMNYLPDAKAHGAQIFCEVEVTAVLKSPSSSQWIVHYKRLGEDAFELEEQIVMADFVFLGAGSLGSTKILLRSKERGLDVSDKLGEHFSTNGDLLGFSYSGKDKANCIGKKPSEVDPKSKDNYPPGPTITAVVDHREMPKKEVWEGYVLEDGAPPSLLKFPFVVVTALADKIFGVDKHPEGDMWEKLARDLDWSCFDNTLSMLAMSHDSSTGRLSIADESKDVVIDWKRVGHQKNFGNVANAMEKAAKGLKGTFVMNPTWNNAFGKTLVCPHPLGGCIMGESGELGVVNHAGQVFQGESSEVFEGLLVVDGAIIPRSVGVNPVWTISTVAERCMRLHAQRHGWKIDYDSTKQLGSEAFSPLKPGLEFTERMIGEVTLKKKNNPSSCEFLLTIQSNDVEHMIEKDPMHQAKIVGTVTCPGLSKKPMTVSDGYFKLFNKHEDAVETKSMVYSLVLTTTSQNLYYFYGEKIIHKDSAGEVGLEDTTTLFVKIYKGKNAKGQVVAEGVLKMRVSDFMKQLTTIEITNCPSLFKRLSWKLTFGNFFAASLWDTYSGMSKNYALDPDAPPREKRPLRLNGVVPEVYNVMTEDKMRLRLTRYNGGPKGPVLLLHGLGVNSGIYTLDTIDTNLVEYLIAHKYDIWLYDFRMSVALPWASGTQMTLDDIAEYDFTAGVDKVLEVTGQETVQVLAHCVGSITFFNALLRGKLKGKIRSLISSQVATHMVPSTPNKIKGGLHVSTVLQKMGLDGLSTNVYIDGSFVDKMMSKIASTWTTLTTEYEERCKSVVCHRSTLMYGLLWEHDNLNSATHDTLSEVFGYANSTIFRHLARCFREGHQVDAEGNDNLLKHIENLDIPITFIHGEENAVFKPESTLETLNYLKAAHPHQDYDRHVIEDYGHLDCFMGKNAVYDVFPHVLTALDKYAQDDRLKDQNLLNQMISVCQRKDQKPKGCEEPPMTPTRLDPCKERVLSEDMCDNLPPAPGGSSPSKPIGDSNRCSHDAVEDKEIPWPPKTECKNIFRKEAKYRLPKSSDNEKVQSVTVSFSEDCTKREIVVISDMHLGGPWSGNACQKLRYFFKTIQQDAEEKVHSLILLGDVFEMWMYQFTEPQLKRDEMMSRWLQDDLITFMTSQVRELAEKMNVNVFYVRGNHDHELTKEMAEQLFGPKINFVEGKLIFLVNDGEKQYRMRFEHGHDQDLFNTYSLEETAEHKPIGYFVSRAMASSESVQITDLQMNLQAVVGVILDELVPDLVGSLFIDMIRAFSGLQKQITENLMEFALGREIGSNEATLLEDEQYIKFQRIYHWKYIEKAAIKFGSTKAYSMIKASLGEYDDFIEQWAEDVVVLAHTHKSYSGTFKGKNGNVIYVNSGCWLGTNKQVSFVRILTPRGCDCGRIEIRSLEEEEEK